MNRKTEAVDIIVPVYNGYEDLQRCIPSIKRHTDLTKHRLVLINDCSPDARIRPYLDALADEHILVLHNEKNRGFSANVNIGMGLTGDRDVLLLNSDTVVTAGWLEKIAACAYRDDSIGTVTPLSNSATLCSVPVMCQDNPVPEHLTIDAYAALIERCSLRRYPRITVAVGFCMFIKRCLIDDIGTFDAETFGRGYGEENDFCNRAEQAGYCHVMCDDTFVYHRGTGSFDTEEKQALQKAHTAVLDARYPEQMRRNHLYCMENPDQEIRDNLNLYTKLENGKKNLLYVLHLDFRENARNRIGGTQNHVSELTRELRRDFNVFVMARDGEYLGVTAYTETEEFPLRFEIGEAPQFPVFRDSRVRRICDEVLRAFRIDLVHVHHTQNLSLEIYRAAREQGIPLITTLHDYYYVCPTLLLLDSEWRFCAGQDARTGQEPHAEQETRTEQEPHTGQEAHTGQETRTGQEAHAGQEARTGQEVHAGQEARTVRDGHAQRCRDCLWEKKGIVPEMDYLRIWRRENESALRTCRELVFPSNSVRDLFRQYFPALENSGRVIYHGEDPLTGEAAHVPPPEHVKKSAGLTVRLDHVCGADRGLNDIKGWAYLAGVPEDETEVLVELTDAGGKKDCLMASRTARADVVEALGKPDALMCGLDLRVRSDVLTEGPVKIRVYVKHGNQIFTDGQSFDGQYRRRYGAAGRLNAAFLGGMVPQKGSRLARELISMDRTETNWFILGAVGDHEILELRQENCFFSSDYRREELPQLLSDNEIDVVLLLSICPETFCYTLSEAWMNGIPVIGTDIGAIGERIRATGGGWLVRPDASPEEILELLRRIRSCPEEYEEKKQAVQRIRLKSVAQMCGEYRALYEEILKGAGRRPEGERADYDFLFQGLALANPSVGGHGGAASMNRLRQENEALRSSIEVLKGTSSYRLARKIAEVNIPFKEQLKKQARRLMGKKNADA